MRLSILPILIAGASVVNFVVAEPNRGVDDANIRFGHVLENANVNGNDDSVRIVRPPAFITPPPVDKDKGLTRHICGESLRDKAIRLSNAFRHALGMPLIEVTVAVPVPGEVHILPAGFPPHDIDDEDGKPRKHHAHEHPNHPEDGEGGEHFPHHRHRYGHHHKHHKSFLRRIHKAIKALGPWEGRAVAFVLGCGIGVLLRMFWVLSVLVYRTIRGERGDETIDHEYVVYEQVPETIYVAPPQYFDEKAKVESHEEEACK